MQCRVTIDFLSDRGISAKEPIRLAPPCVRRSSLPRSWLPTRALGFEGVQLHDDDAVPNVDNKTSAEVEREAKELKKVLDDQGLVPEFVAPRLWEDPRGVDGGFTANCRKARQWAIDRTKRAIDIASALGTRLMVLWLAREGTYIRESKNAIQAYQWQIDAINALLEHNPEIEFAIEPKPNEPMDQAYVPTIGHALAIAYQTIDPARVGGLIETAHARLAGLDAADEMAFALALGKLWSVHLNDQNGLKFDQDKSFGSADLRSAYNQVRVLELADYAETGRFVGLGRQGDAHAEGGGGRETPGQQQGDLPAVGREGPHVPQGCRAAVHRES